MDLSHGRMPHIHQQYQGHNAYTNAVNTQQEYNNTYNNTTTTQPQQDYRYPRPKGPWIPRKKTCKMSHNQPLRQGPT